MIGDLLLAIKLDVWEDPFRNYQVEEDVELNEALM